MVLWERRIREVSLGLVLPSLCCARSQLTLYEATTVLGGAREMEPKKLSWLSSVRLRTK